MLDIENSGLLAAIDLGSNSFHMVVARRDHGGLQLIDSLSEKVQLAAGFDERGRLNDLVQERALACLGRFAQHLRGVDPEGLRVVGTNALRIARNASAFLKRAERLLGCPIEVISGREEARLIYLGVSHTQVDRGRQLVVDIGGGSTEFIVGEHFEPLLMESLHMGCVSYQRRFFADGFMSEAAMEAAILAARQEVMLIAQEYCQMGWDAALGSSGTIKALLAVLEAMGLAPDGAITMEGLQALREKIQSYRHAMDMDFPGLKDDRKPLLASGLCIALGLFQELGVERMGYSEGALREGVLFDLLGRWGHEDIRVRTVQAMQGRYHVDIEQAARVRDTAQMLAREFVMQADCPELDQELLLQAAELHEIGLGIAHSGFHKHGAYLLRYSDMPGFSRSAQERLSILVGAHRRKIREEQKHALSDLGGLGLVYTCVVLRLAVLLHHSRHREPLPRCQIAWTEGVLALRFPRGWLERKPLTLMDLQQEAGYLLALGVTLELG